MHCVHVCRRRDGAEIGIEYQYALLGVQGVRVKVAVQRSAEAHTEPVCG